MKNCPDEIKMLRFYNSELKDITPRNFGYEKCRPGQTGGPHKWTAVLIHYVESGRGTLEKGGVVYDIGPGEVFIIMPGELARYKADENDPWFYRWICFCGDISLDFAKIPPVFKYSGDIFREICSLEDYQGNREIMFTSCIMRFYAELFPEPSKKGNYVSEAKKFIDSNYMFSISVEQIANQMNLNRSYLTKLFKKETGMSIQSYLIIVRMRKACKYLEEKKTVTETAYLCGYSDYTHFSKMFKKVYDISPQHYRQNLKL